MSEMVERVAKALAEKRSADMAAKFPVHMGYYGVKWETFTEEQREQERGYARLAIEAMREPTDAMVLASRDALKAEVRPTPSERRLWQPLKAGGYRFPKAFKATVRWRAMIDEALR